MGRRRPQLRETSIVTKILIVDDDRTMVLALSVRLRSAGLEVITCQSAHDASHVALRERPDVLLLDVDMPHFTGLELHECLRLTERGRRLPVIYVSGSVSPSDHQIAFRQGAKAFIRKPFDPQTLIDTIRSVLDGRCADSPV